MKKIICFDLDGTLAESKSEITPDMAYKLGLLSMKYKIAIISGGSFKQYSKQLLPKLCTPFLEYDNLFLFPTCATSFYVYSKNDNWQKVYEELLTDDEKYKIIKTFHTYMPEFFIDEYKRWGDILEDRGTQITFSALGQFAPIEDKKLWDPDLSKRNHYKSLIETHLPKNLEIKTGGSTSLDVTKKGIDKAYGIEKIKLYLKVENEDILFIGDALYPNGNDEPVKLMGIDCLEVKGPEDTIKIIEKLLEE